MILVNDSMKKYLQNGKFCNSDELIKVLLTQMNYIKLFWDCVVIDVDDTLSENKIREEIIFKIAGDKTGYEANLNEIMLTVPTEYTAPIIDISSAIIKKLKNEFPNRIFCVVISVDDENVCTRFHTVRKDEPFWCSQDLDGFMEPVFEEIL